MAEFYNENSNRAYPFLTGQLLVPNSAVVACGFVLGPGSGFVAGENTVYLARVTKVGSQLFFYFRSDAPGLLDSEILFSREVSDPQYVIEYADSDFPGSASESTSALVCDFLDGFSGFLVTGNLTELVAALEDANGELEGTATVEPALLQDISQDYVRSINLANAERTRWIPPAGCPDHELAFATQPHYVRGKCLQGHVRFREGYNCAIRQSDALNQLTFDAIVGGSEGEPCEDVPLFEGEEIPTNATYRDGSLSCSEVLRSINGVGGSYLDVIGGRGVSVSYMPAESTVIIDVDTRGLAACAEFSPPVAEEDCLSVSEI